MHLFLSTKWEYGNFKYKTNFHFPIWHHDIRESFYFVFMTFKSNQGLCRAKKLGTGGQSNSGENTSVTTGYFETQTTCMDLNKIYGQNTIIKDFLPPQPPWKRKSTFVVGTTDQLFKIKSFRSPIQACEESHHHLAASSEHRIKKTLHNTI